MKNNYKEIEDKVNARIDKYNKAITDGKALITSAENELKRANEEVKNSLDDADVNRLIKAQKDEDEAKKNLEAVKEVAKITHQRAVITFEELDEIRNMIVKKEREITTPALDKIKAKADELFRMIDELNSEVQIGYKLYDDIYRVYAKEGGTEEYPKGVHHQGFSKAKSFTFNDQNAFNSMTPAELLKRRMEYFVNLWNSDKPIGQWKKE